MSASVDALLARLADVEGRLAEHAARPLPAGLADPDPGAEERWEAGQIWAHLGEFPAYWLAQARRVVAEPTNPPVPFGRVKTDSGRVEAVERDRRTDPKALLERVRTALDEVGSEARSWDAETWQCTGMHPTRGEMSVEQIVRTFIVDHLEEHADQLDGLGTG